MSFRNYINQLEKIQVINAEVSKKLKAGAIINTLVDQPVLFNNIAETNFRVAGNIFPSKKSVAAYFSCAVDQLIPTISKAIRHPRPPEIITQAPCQQLEFDEIDLNKLPILFHFPNDGGNFISSGVVIACDDRYGQNMDFHRCMQISANKFSIRVVKNRHFYQFLEQQRQMPMAICIGNGAEVLIAGATSVNIGQDELEIANSLKPIRVVKARTFNAYIPADCELVLEGTIDIDERAKEGPFVDLTETQDIVRREPVFTVQKITHRRDAIWQALLPGKLEHKILMGMPREPTIFDKINQAGIKCLDVNVNAGGCSWLHARVKIDKQREDDGRNAIGAAFAGHKSCKHVFVVDKDIDIYDDQHVEWAMATRFQADKDLIVKDREAGSSLDPSSEKPAHLTTKCGFDLTAPLGPAAKYFAKVQFPQVNLQDYLES